MMLTLGYTRSASGNHAGFWVNHAGTISRRYYEAISLLFFFQMAFKVSLAMLRTPKGLFKILEFVLVLVCILIACFGAADKPDKDEGVSYLGDTRDVFLTSGGWGGGTLLGFEIILIAFLLTYLLGAEPAFLVRQVPTSWMEVTIFYHVIIEPLPVCFVNYIW